jgi:hypothetical protein
MVRPYSYWKLILVICLAVVAFGAVTASAYVRPANPTMDYVPQNEGIYDAFYTYFNEPECRTCHGTSTAERHHHTTYALNGDCLYCHYGYPITVPTERDCKACHTDTSSIIPYPGSPGGGGDLLGYPHHRSDLADSWQCTGCHDPNLLSETYTVPVPSYEVSDITPTPASCENCHWQSDTKTDGGHVVGAVYPGNNAALFEADWDTWIGIPKPTSYNDGLVHPAPIGHNGMQTSGVLWSGGVDTFGITMPAKPSKDSSFGLHEQPGNITSECYLCHSQNPDDSFNTAPNDPNNIRACESCHDIYTLHGIEEHVTTNSIYTQNGALNQTVYCDPGASWKCVACHGDNMPPAPEAAVHPVIDPLPINFGSPGVVFDILPTGVSFGLKMAGGCADGDCVQMCQPLVAPGACLVASDWEEVPTYSWDEHLIRARVPGWTFAPDTNTKVRVHKHGAGNSNQRNFTIRKHPEITTLAPSAGQYGEDVIVYGLGFYTNRKTISSGAYSFETYAELSASNDTYRVYKFPASVQPWTSTAIGMRLKPLLDVRTGSSIPPSLSTLLYVGNWNVTVVTDYFIDDGDGQYLDPATGKLDLRTEDVEPWNLADGPNGTGSPDGDELIWRERSVPAVFNVNSDPAIWNINSTKIPAGDSMKITGINFGSSQGTGKVRVGVCKEVIGDLIPGTTLLIGDDDGKCEGWTEILGDGRGNDNGKCEDNEPCQKEVCYVNTTGSKLANVKTWSTTKVVAKVPSFPGLPKKKCVQVELSNGKISNAFKIKILAP